MDNDVMFGKPISRFSSLEEGKRVYENGQVRPDLYKLEKRAQPDNGLLKIQIKEIEPEVSAYDHIRMRQVLLHKSEHLFVRSDFTGYILVDDSVLKSAKPEDLVVTDQQEKDLTEILFRTDFGAGKEASSYDVAQGEYIDIRLKRGSNSGDQFLILESWYRDWTLGDIYVTESVPGFNGRSRKYGLFSKQNLVTGIIGSLVGVLGGNAYFASQAAAAVGIDRTLADSFAVQRAHADVPRRSLDVRYRDGKGTYRPIDIIEPRYNQPSAVAILLPDQSFDEEGYAHIRITATKHHKISGIAVASQTIRSVTENELVLRKAVSKRTNIDYTEVLSTPHSGEYLETLPGDVVELEFAAKQEYPEQKCEYLIRFGGVYAEASKEDQRRAGKWTANLDDQAIAMLSEVYNYSRNS